MLFPFVPVTATIGIRARGRCDERPERDRPQPGELAAIRRRRPSAIRDAEAPIAWEIVRDATGRRSPSGAHRPSRASRAAAPAVRARATASAPRVRPRPRPGPPARLRPGELELHRWAGEEPVRPIQDPELNELDVAPARAGPRRHGSNTTGTKRFGRAKVAASCSPPGCPPLLCCTKFLR